MSSWIPAEPAVPSSQRASGRLSLRYEDVSQDGHLVLEALPNATAETWRRLGEIKERALGGDREVLPILSRVILENADGPIPVFGPSTTEGLFQLAHTVDGAGAVDRLVLNLWARVSSLIGHTTGRPPPDAGRPCLAGRIFAEHVFTRPLGPPERRKVLSLHVDGAPFVPPDPWTFRAPEASAALPEGAVALDDDLVPDTTFTVFGLDHTDSNQHTNSLVYTRLFIEAALRRLDAHGRARPPLLARQIEIAYRKPSFAGERVRVLARAFTLEGALGATAVLMGEEEAARPRGTVRPRVFARMTF
jgi:hypothetical protein